MKLELKHLAPYLPYGLKIINESGTGTQQLNKISISHIILYDRIKEVKPILRPLSDITKEIEHNGEKFVPYNEIRKNYGFSKSDLAYLQRNLCYITRYGICEKLFEWNFDVFGLIEAGLAIDINDLN